MSFDENDWSFIERNLEELKKILPKLNYKRDGNNITIGEDGEESYSVEIEFWGDEIVVYGIEGWHDHIGTWNNGPTKREALIESLELVTSLLSDRVRLRVGLVGNNVRTVNYDNPYLILSFRIPLEYFITWLNWEEVSVCRRFILRIF